MAQSYQDGFGGTPVTGSTPEGFGGELVHDPNPSRIPGIQEDTEEASGGWTAFVSGLTNDEANKVFWIASKRFPEMVEEGKNPADLYAFDEDGDLFYRDPETGEYKKEFGQDWFGFEVDYIDNIGPVGQFLSEVIGSTVGMGAGYLAGGFPGAMIGGAKGSAVWGGSAYASRAALSAALGGPPLEVATALKDLTVASGFSAIPLGVPTRGAPASLKWVLDKFPGTDGRSALSDVVQNGGRTVDEKLAYMAEKYPDVSLSRAEANDLIGTAGHKVEVWVAKHAKNEELINHYNSRSERLEYHAERLFERILAGRLASSSVRAKMKGQPTVLDPDLDVARLADEYIEAEKKKLAEITAPMYRDAYEMDVAIDVGDILKEIDSVIANPNTSSKKLSAFEEMRKALIDASQDGDVARSSTELLHEGLKDNFNRLISGLTKDADSSLKREVSIIRDNVSRRMKEANPLYADVTKIYDDAYGTAQALDRTIVGQFAKVAGYGERATRLTQKLFTNKNIKPAEIQELKRIMQETDEGAKAWQNLKGTWLSSQWEEVILSGDNVLGAPNKFLKAAGIPNPARSFPRVRVAPEPGGFSLPPGPDELARMSDELYEYAARGKKAKLWEAILEPDEFAAFADMTSLMQMIGRIQTKAGSDTFGNTTLGALLSREARMIAPGEGIKHAAGQTAKNAGGLIAAITSLPARVFSKGFGDLVDGIRNRQTEAYMDLLISHIVDGKKRAVLEGALEAVNPMMYLMSQTFIRGGAEGLDQFVFGLDNEEKKREFRNRGEEVIQQQQQEQDQEQNRQEINQALEAAVPTALNLPMFPDAAAGPGSIGGLDPAMSPTILPRAGDRELAMRLRGGQGGGIASLA
tara:strand:- start:1832 stop:4423 length:2592 start_codon:yes stop_codon:yes gene_type:complete